MAAPYRIGLANFNFDSRQFNHNSQTQTSVIGLDFFLPWNDLVILSISYCYYHRRIHIYNKPISAFFQPSRLQQKSFPPFFPHVLCTAFTRTIIILRTLKLTHTDSLITKVLQQTFIKACVFYQITRRKDKMAYRPNHFKSLYALLGPLPVPVFLYLTFKKVFIVPLNCQ